MGDYASMFATVYHCPPTRLTDTADVLAHWGLASTIEELTLGERYYDHEARLGTPEEMALELEALGCSYWMAQDGRYEYPGYTIMYTPQLGRFESPSDNEANITLTAERIDAIINAGIGGRTLVSNLCASTGLLWRLHFAPLDDLKHDELLAQSEQLYPSQQFPRLVPEDAQRLVELYRKMKEGDGA